MSSPVWLITVPSPKSQLNKTRSPPGAQDSPAWKTRVSGFPALRRTIKLAVGACDMPVTSTAPEKMTASGVTNTEFARGVALTVTFLLKAARFSMTLEEIRADRYCRELSDCNACWKAFFTTSCSVPNESQSNTFAYHCFKSIVGVLILSTSCWLFNPGIQLKVKSALTSGIYHVSVTQRAVPWNTTEPSDSETSK